MVAHNFGILQPKGTDNVLDVPGTALLEELEQRTISADAFSKRDSKNPEISARRFLDGAAERG